MGPLLQLSAEAVHRFARDVLLGLGARPESADLVAAALVKASLQGHDSHGILRLARYVDKVRQGTLDPTARLSVTRQGGAVAVVDGHDGFGQVIAARGVREIIPLARQYGVAAVALRHTNHVGRLADYAETIAESGLIALIFAGGAEPGGSVAPYGGRERIFGTNPIAWAVPVSPGQVPLVADFSLSSVPEGKVAMAVKQQTMLEPGILLDRQGRASTNPADFYAGGALLPFGGHKGYALLLFGEILANLLGGSVPVSSPEYQRGNPTVIVALKLEAFMPPADFVSHVEALRQRVISSAPAQGFERVLLPNEMEAEVMSRRRLDGIPFPFELAEEWRKLAKEFNLNLGD